VTHMGAKLLVSALWVPVFKDAVMDVTYYIELTIYNIKLGFHISVVDCRTTSVATALHTTRLFPLNFHNYLLNPQIALHCIALICIVHCVT